MLLVKSFKFSPIQENTYILYNEFNECAIIDPGCYFDDEKDTLNEFITANNLTVKLLLNTHGHLDHIFGNKMVSEKYKLTPQIHENELPVLAFATTSGLMYNLPFDAFTGQYDFLQPGQIICLGQNELEVIFTPGHSPGSVSFYCAKDGFIISGDTLFKNSIGRTDLPLGNHEQLIESIQTQLLTLPASTLVYSGHGPVTTIGYEKKNNPYLQ